MILIVDEGDPLNEILSNKSKNNIKASGLFSNVDYNVLDTNNEFKKDIEIIVTEQPTGEISAGAGYGTSGQTFSFGIKENNFAGNATKLNTNLTISPTSIKGGLNFIIPNYNYSDKSLRLNLSRTTNDFLSTSGFENTVSNFTFGTGFEYKQDLFFTPLMVFEAESLTTNSTASSALKKQDGNYNNIEFDYSFSTIKEINHLDLQMVIIQNLINLYLLCLIILLYQIPLNIKLIINLLRT